MRVFLQNKLSNKKLSIFISFAFLSFYTLLVNYLFIKDLYFYFDDFSVFSGLYQGQSIFPVFTDRPIAGLLFMTVFSLFHWNSIYYHVLGAILEIIISLIVYCFFYKFIIFNHFYSLLVTLFFLVMPGHSQQHWWVILISLKLVFIAWILSLYLFSLYLKQEKYLYLCASALVYGLTLFLSEYALFLPIIYSILHFYSKYKPKETKFNFKKYVQAYVQAIIPYLIFMSAFLVFRLTDSFGLSSSFDRTGLNSISEALLKFNNLTKAIIWKFPQMEYAIGMKHFQTIAISHQLSITLYLSSFIALTIVWYLSFANQENLKFNDHLFIMIFGCGWLFFSTIAFAISKAWFDTRHAYLPHLGLAVLIVLVVSMIFNFICKINQPIIRNIIIILMVALICFPITKAAESIIGEAYLWKQIGIELRNQEKIIKNYFPTVKNNTLFLIKDAITNIDYAPVFAGSWVIDGFFDKIYPLQYVTGTYYNHSENNKEQLMFTINPDLNSINLAGQKYYFDQVIILDGKNQLRPFSAIHVKTNKGDYLKRLETSPNSATIAPVLELAIP